MSNLNTHNLQNTIRWLVIVSHISDCTENDNVTDHHIKEILASTTGGRQPFTFDSFIHSHL